MPSVPISPAATCRSADRAHRYSGVAGRVALTLPGSSTTSEYECRSPGLISAGVARLDRSSRACSHFVGEGAVGLHGPCDTGEMVAAAFGMCLNAMTVGYGVVMTNLLERPKHPLRLMVSGPYGHPYHPILVTVPIGAWVASLIFDIASHVVSGPAFLARGSEWLIAIGIIGALLAAVVGLLDFLRIPSRTPAARVGLIHMSLNLGIVAAYVANFFWRYGDYHSVASVRIGQLVLSAASLAALSVSGYLGGQLAYRYGVRVAEERTQAEGYRVTPPKAGHSARAGSPSTGS